MITVDNVCVNYHRIPALSDASLTLPAGHITALIGPNGAGKSTLFKAIMGLVPLSSGAVKTEGIISYVPQHDDVNWNFPLSVRDVVKSGAQPRWLGRMSAAQKQRVAEAMEATGISDLAGRHISELSGGQKKRVFVARGLAQGAHVMLLDEPFAGVDQGTEASLITLFHTLRDQGVCLLIATHNLEQVPALADSVAMINRTVVASGAPDEVMSKENLLQTFSAREN